MIRFILITERKDPNNGLVCSFHHTLLVKCPELERELTSGGYSESGYTITTLVGVEVCDDSA